MMTRCWRSLSLKEKSIFLMLFAVLLPTVILFYGQYRALSELRDKSKATFENDLRRTFTEIEDETENRLLEAASQILRDFPESGQLPWDGERMKTGLSQILDKNPGLESAFVFTNQTDQFKLAITTREAGYRESRTTDNPSDALILIGEGKQEEDFVLPLLSSLQSSINRRRGGDFF